MLLDAILKAISQIESMKERSAEVDRVLVDLKETVNVRTRESLLDIMTIGDRKGYDEIRNQLGDLLEFIDSAEKKNHGK